MIATAKFSTIEDIYVRLISVAAADVKVNIFIPIACVAIVNVQSYSKTSFIIRLGNEPHRFLIGISCFINVNMTELELWQVIVHDH